MRNKYDIIVVGSGLSALIAAITAAESGKKCAILTKGAGSITVGSGVIDVLGYLSEKNSIDNPFDGISKLNEKHPYKLLGAEKVKESLEYFVDLTKKWDYEYSYTPNKNTMVPTAAGTLKPTYLYPATFDIQALENAKEVILLGFKGLKDYFNALVYNSISKNKGYENKKFTQLEINLPFIEGRDLSALDIARYLDSDEGVEWFIKTLKSKLPAKSVIILPPVLGTKADYIALKNIKDTTGFHFIETVALPPSVTGCRLRDMMYDAVKSKNVAFYEQTTVTRAELDGKRCKSLVVSSSGRDRYYEADSFIICTGGFFSSGIIAEHGKAYEAIFKIDLDAPKNQEDWSNERFFSAQPHLFATMGVTVDNNLKAVDNTGATLFDNVYFAGKTLGGYDYAVEKSGNGVALATGYHAAKNAINKI